MESLGPLKLSGSMGPLNLSTSGSLGPLKLSGASTPLNLSGTGSLGPLNLGGMAPQAVSTSKASMGKLWDGGFISDLGDFFSIPQVALTQLLTGRPVSVTGERITPGSYLTQNMTPGVGKFATQLAADVVLDPLNIVGIYSKFLSVGAKALAKEATVAFDAAVATEDAVQSAAHMERYASLLQQGKRLEEARPSAALGRLMVGNYQHLKEFGPVEAVANWAAHNPIANWLEDMGFSTNLETRTLRDRNRLMKSMMSRSTSISKLLSRFADPAMKGLEDNRVMSEALSRYMDVGTEFRTAAERGKLTIPDMKAAIGEQMDSFWHSEDFADLEKAYTGNLKNELQNFAVDFGKATDEISRVGFDSAVRSGLLTPEEAVMRWKAWKGAHLKRIMMDFGDVGALNGLRDSLIIGGDEFLKKRGGFHAAERALKATMDPEEYDALMGEEGNTLSGMMASILGDHIQRISPANEITDPARRGAMRVGALTKERQTLSPAMLHLLGNVYDAYDQMGVMLSDVSKSAGSGWFFSDVAQTFAARPGAEDKARYLEQVRNMVPDSPVSQSNQLHFAASKLQDLAGRPEGIRYEDARNILEDLHDSGADALPYIKQLQQARNEADGTVSQGALDEIMTALREDAPIPTVAGGETAGYRTLEGMKDVAEQAAGGEPVVLEVGERLEGKGTLRNPNYLYGKDEADKLNMAARDAMIKEWGDKLIAKGVSPEEVARRSYLQQYPYAIRKFSEPWAVMETDPSFGELSGIVLPKTIRDEIVNATKEADGFLKVSSRIMSPWKWGMVVGSPPAHVRNWVTNMIMNHVVGGLSPFRVSIYSTALKEALQQDGKYWRIAQEYDLDHVFNKTALLELTDIKDTAKRRAIQELGDGGSVPRFLRAVQTLAGGARDKMNGMFELSETVGKHAQFIYQLEQGKTVREAEKVAQEALFNYRQIPYGLSYLRRSGLIPFPTFTYKAIPALVKATINNPARTQVYIRKLPQAVGGLFLSNEDQRSARAGMPDYIKKAGYNAYVPVGWGKALSYGPFSPYQTIEEVGSMPLEPFGAFGQAFTDLSRNQTQFGGPVFKPGGNTFVEAANYAAERMLPPLAYRTPRDIIRGKVEAPAVFGVRIKNTAKNAF